MANFIGEYNCKIDSKGRILFPAALKKQLSDTNSHFIIKKDLFENCLVIYTNEEWEQQNQTIRNGINTFNKEHNRFLRGFFRGAAEMYLDSSNRILVPKRLIDAIGVNKEIVLSGLDTKIEMWAKESYDKMQEDEMEFATLAEKIMQNKNGEA